MVVSATRHLVWLVKESFSYSYRTLKCIYVHVIVRYHMVNDAFS